MGRSITLSEFKKRAKNKHADRYDYSLVEYKDKDTKVKIICPVHGIFKQSPHNHYRYGCHSCGGNKRLTTDEFINRAVNVHNNKYTYKKTHYVNNTTPVIITCPIHGDFLQQPNNHMCAKGCMKCQTGCYNPSYFNLHPEGKSHPSVLYFVKFKDIITGIEFLKIGITKKSIEVRFGRYKSHYDIEVISHSCMPLYDAYLKEQKIINTYKNQSKNDLPKGFSGRTECFEYSFLLMTEIMNNIG